MLNRILAGAALAAVLLGAAALPAVMTTPAAAQATEWKLHGDQPVSFWWSEELQKFADGLREKTGGKIDAKYFPSSSLGVAPEAILAPVAAGNVDLAEFVASYVAGEAQYLTVLGLPMLAGSVEEGRAIMEKVRAAQAEELAKTHQLRILATLTSTPLQLFLAKNDYTGIESLKGLRIRTLGPDQEFFVKSLGAVPTNVPVTEMTSALASNAVDGVIAGTQFFLTQKFIDFGPNVLAWNAILGPGFLVIGESKWQSLDEATRTALTEAAKTFEDGLWTRAATLEKEIQAKAVAEGFKIQTLTDEDRARYVALAKEAWQGWAGRGGPQSKALLDIVAPAQ